MDTAACTAWSSWLRRVSPGEQFCTAGKLRRVSKAVPGVQTSREPSPSRCGTLAFSTCAPELLVVRMQGLLQSLHSPSHSGGQRAAPERHADSPRIVEGLGLLQGARHVAHGSPQRRAGSDACYGSAMLQSELATLLNRRAACIAGCGQRTPDAHPIDESTAEYAARRSLVGATRKRQTPLAGLACNLLLKRRWILRRGWRRSSRS